MDDIEHAVQTRVAHALDGLPETIGAAVERATERAIRRAMADPEMRAQFWKAGYDELEKHAGSNAAQWLGKRLWNIGITAAIAAVLAWIVMSGRIK